MSDEKKSDFVVLYWRIKSSGTEGHGDRVPREVGEAWLNDKRGEDKFEYWLVDA